MLFMPYPIIHIRFSEILKFEFLRLDYKNYTNTIDIRIYGHNKKTITLSDINNKYGEILLNVLT